MSISDLSSYLKVENHKYQPTLMDMVFLEKEVKHLNTTIDEFWYSNEYLDFVTESKGNDSNLDMLLGTQGWRRNLLDDMPVLESIINGLEKGSKERLIREYL